MPSTVSPSRPRGLEPNQPITDHLVKRVVEAIVQRQLGAGGIQVKRFGRRMVVDGSEVIAEGGAASTSWTGLVEVAERISANRWRYTVTEAIPKSTEGYTLVGPSSTHYRVTVTNRLEDNNAASGMLGIGLLAEDIPDGFALQPIPPLAAPITVFGETLPSGSIRWRTDYSNAVGGQCPPDADSSLAISNG